MSICYRRLIRNRRLIWITSNGHYGLNMMLAQIKDQNLKSRGTHSAQPTGYDACGRGYNLRGRAQLHICILKYE